MYFKYYVMQTEHKMASIAILTATKNCGKQIPRLISSLQMQTDQNFTWIVADSESMDDTLQIVEDSGLKAVHIVSSPDFSIYDALNKAIRECRDDYYMVLGADDVIESKCVANYRATAVASGAEFVFSSVQTFGTVRRPMSGATWLRGGNAFCASHSVGALIRRSLHERFGFYSNRFANAADMHFILKASKANASIAVGDFVAGNFSNDGISSTDELASLTDFFRIQIEMGERVALQYALFVLRAARVCIRHNHRKRFG